MIVVKKITPTIGAVIEGVNFSEPMLDNPGRYPNDLW